MNELLKRLPKGELDDIRQRANEELDVRETCTLCQQPIEDTNTDIYSYPDYMLCDACHDVKNREADEERGLV